MSNEYTVNLRVSACFEYEVKYLGNPLKKEGTNSNNYGNMDAKACQNLCQKTDGCGWFNRNKDGCYLKTGMGTKSSDPGGVSGPRSCTDS